MKKVLIILTVVAVLCCTAFSVISVSAEQIGTNDFFDFDIYSKYKVNGEVISVTTTLPDWYYTKFKPTNVEDVSAYNAYGNDISFTFNQSTYQTANLDIFGFPFGFDGEQSVISNGHFFDLYKLPSSFIMTGGLTVSIPHIPDSHFQTFFVSYECFFVDENGKVLTSYSLPVDLLTDNEVNSVNIKEYRFTFDSSTIIIPDSARGLYFVFYTCCTTDGPGTFTLSLHYSPFTINFSINDAFFNFKNQEIVRDKLANIDKALDDIKNGEVNPEKPVDSDKFDDLKENEDELLGDVENYLDEGIGFFDNAVGAIFNFANGFQAIKVLMIPVFNLPMFGDIILVSVSLGLIGTLLGVVTMVTSSINKNSKSKSRGKTKGIKKGG